ncbi:FAD-dependent oxidoreductase [Chitinophaga agrisoli]|uniref:FAD-dependent oxidoreductase n=1 Tax=Chitinophaga agrisoli TaxID=2607653 RepID=A0A5B2VYQ7_9BACT|nr:FAD-dependent oxidoreductase [Chitinophaga agrisoli]KAA2244993.1 FAD-dependent oxidoreductase [Chitinophaga agrisoli]
MEQAQQNEHKGIDSNLTSGIHSSYWIDSLPALQFMPLEGSIETDVVIVGGGMAGISIAYQLTRQGKKVVVIEDGDIGSGETGRTTAHLATALDDRYYELERIFGKEGARYAAESHRTAIDIIEQTIQYESISCDFERVTGYLFLHPSDQEASLQKEYAAAREAGLDVELLDAAPGLSRSGRCLAFANQAQFHPLKYLHGLCQAITANGGQLFTATKAVEIDHTGVVTDQGFRVDAAFVVVATNTPVNDRYVMHLKQFAYRTYVIGGLVAKDAIPHALWWDTGDFKANANIPPYHYVRLQSYDETHDLLICGGEDHATGLAFAQHITDEERYRQLECWAREKFDITEIIYRWSGQVMEPMDSLAYIGRNPADKDNVFIVTGDSGNGMTHATIASLLIPDLIQGNVNKWKKIYDPQRFKFFRSGKTWLKEFAGGLFRYMREYPYDADAVELSSIGQGGGKIVELGNSKYGVHRDEEDDLHVVAAECTHLHCIVQWNNDEQSWDCPCHGSRFTYKGKVINGPANKDLFYYREKAPETSTRIGSK